MRVLHSTLIQLAGCGNVSTIYVPPRDSVFFFLTTVDRIQKQATGCNAVGQIRAHLHKTEVEKVNISACIWIVTNALQAGRGRLASQ